MQLATTRQSAQADAESKALDAKREQIRKENVMLEDKRKRLASETAKLERQRQLQGPNRASHDDERTIASSGHDAASLPSSKVFEHDACSTDINQGQKRRARPGDTLEDEVIQAAPRPKKVPRTTVTKSSASLTALQGILGANADTPPAPRGPLASGKINVRREDNERKAETHKEGKKPSSSKASTGLPATNDKVEATVIKTAKKDASQARVPPSSAALAARERVQRAVAAARARS